MSSVPQNADKLYLSLCLILDAMDGIAYDS